MSSPAVGSAGAPVLDRSSPPVGDRRSGDRQRFQFPAFRRSRLANGFEILAAALPRVPLVSLEVLAPAGGQYNSLELPGLASLHGQLLDEGTDRLSTLEIAERVEALGGSLHSDAGWNMAYVETALLSRHLAPGLELLVEILRTPCFPPSEIERLRQERQAEILLRRGMPSSLAERFFAAAVYGGTVYGRPLIGTEEALERIQRSDLLEFYRRHIVPTGATLIAVGDLDPEELCARADELFGDWPQATPPTAPTIAPKALGRTEVHLVDRPGSTQTQLQIGHVGVPRRHPDFHTLMFLNAIYGGKFTSRINLNLREEHGYTYGANSFFVHRQGPGPFVIRTAVATAVAGAAVGELVAEMRRICEEPVTAEELRETRDYLVGIFPYTLQSIGDLTKRLESLVVFDLGDDYFEHYPGILTGITRDQLLAAAREHLHPDHLAIVAVGPAEELRPQLEGLGPVTVHSPDLE